MQNYIRKKFKKTVEKIVKNKLVHGVVNNVDKFIHKTVEEGGKVLLFVLIRVIIKELWKLEI